MNYRGLRAIMLSLEIEIMTSGRAASALNLWAISPPLIVFQSASTLIVPQACAFAHLYKMAMINNKVLNRPVFSNTLPSYLTICIYSLINSLGWTIVINATPELSHLLLWQHSALEPWLSPSWLPGWWDSLCPLLLSIRIMKLWKI